MYQGQTVFAQLMQFIPWRAFYRIVARYGGDRGVRQLNCAQQFRAMAFAQLTHRRSLRDLVACLEAVPAKLYHSGCTAPLSFSTLARANERRSWQIYQDLAQHLITRARPLYAEEDLGLNLDDTVYALDSSTVDLCLSVFGWAPFRATKAAVKLHTLLDLRGSLPSFIHISDGKLHDVKALDLIGPEPGAIYVMDRAYVDFGRLFRLHQAGACFVTRAKKNLRWHRVYSAPKDRTVGIEADQLIALDGKRARQAYPLHLRRVRYRDPASGQRLVFLTNRRDLPASTVCALYKQRWQVELFFRWMKQHLEIQRFFGTSENAVKSQIWVAVAVYVLVAIVRKELGIELSPYRMMQTISVMPFEQVLLPELFTESRSVPRPDSSGQQQLLFQP